MRRPDKLLRLLRKRDSSAAACMGNARKVSKDFRYLNSGCERKAFRWGTYVVKKTSAWIGPCPVRELARVGLRPPQQWFVNGWTVQPFYRRVRMARDVCRRLYTAEADIGEYNVGKDERGRFVAFDW